MDDLHRTSEDGLADMRIGPFVPGRNADPDILALKKNHLRDPHVAPINALADAIADAEGIDRGSVPYVDPQLGGVEARVLALLDNPSTKAEVGTGSGLLSLENDDRTARNCAAFYNDLRLSPGQFVHWNVAPAPIAGVKNGGSSLDERERGAAWLRELVALLPDLQTVLLMGEHARDGWKRSGLDLPGVHIPEDVPHPSQRGLNNRDGRVRLRRALLEVADVVSGKMLPAERSEDRGLSETAATGSAENRSREWAWWPTFEHYCSPGSTPRGVSSELSKIELAIDHADLPAGKWGVVARRSRSDWTVVARRKQGRTVNLADYQAVKYDGARSGGPRGNLGPIPAGHELTARTRDLDA